MSGFQSHQAFEGPYTSSGPRRWGRSRASLLIMLAVAVVVGFVVGILIGRFGIARDDAGGSDISPEEAALAEEIAALVKEADEDISDKILDAIDPKNIEENLRILSERPHIAGRQVDFDLMDFIKGRFEENGLAVQTAPYDVLLSYPNGDVPNTVRLIDTATGDVIYDAVDDESDVSNLEGVVPPFHAYAPAGLLEGELMYVNYGRVEDYQYLRDKGIDVTGKIVIAKYGMIFRGSIVDIATDNGAIGVIIYTDPADYTAKNFGDDRVYPETWWMPPDGVQRGTILVSVKSDPLTPGYPANSLAYRYAEDDDSIALPKIPSTPIGYGAALQIMSRMDGLEAPIGWQGGMDITYKIGPGFTTPDTVVQLNVTNKNERARADNMFGIIRGAVEPDRYVLMGNHRDAWIYGALDPSSGTAVMLEVARVMGQLVSSGAWKPRRTIIFCSWAAEEYGLIGSAEWVEQYVATLRERAIAYVNIDIAVQGNDTIRGGATPLMEDIFYAATQKVRNPNPEEISAGRPTVYDTWKYVTNTADDAKPIMSTLGSGSDFAVIIQRAGITSVDSRYTYDTSKYPVPSYALYHTEYETFEVVRDQFDTGFEYHTAVARVNAEMVRHLADALVIPFDLDSYSRGLEKVKAALDTSSYAELLRQNLDNYDMLDEVIDGFASDVTAFKDRLESLDKNNPYAVREVNDQILLLEKAFLVPEGLPMRPLTKHILWAENSNDAYAGSSFPGLLDLLFEIELADDQESRWEEVRHHWTTILQTIQSAGATLRNVTGFIREEL